MSELLPAFHERYVACIASRDRAQAAALLREVQAATAAGKARGFEPEMTKLSALAGVALAKGVPSRPEPLQKRAAPELPPHLRHEAEAAIERIEAATGRLEKAAAIEAGRAVRQRLDEYWSGISAVEAVQKAQQTRKRMFT